MEETLKYVITADTVGLERGLDAAEAGSRRVNAALGVIAAGAVAAAVAFTASNAKLNEGLANVETLIPGQTARIAELRQEVQSLAIDTGKSTTDITAGLYQVVSAFGDTADTAAILDTNARAAAAGLATTEEAIALTSAVTKGYGDTSAEAVQKAADLAFQTVKLGQTSFPELAASIGKVTPLAAEFGVSQEELFGIMATGTGVVGSAAEVSTQLRGTIAALIKPSDDLADAYERQGIQSGKALIESEGLVGALDFVKAEATAAGVEMTDLGITQESLALALALTGSQADVVREKTAAMGDASGAATKAFDTQTQGVNASAFALDQWKQRAVVFAQDAGAAFEDTFGPGVTAAVLGLGEFGGQIAAMGPQVAIMIAAMGGTAPVMSAVGVAAKFMWAGITGPVGLAVAAVAAIGGAIWIFRDEIQGFLEGAWNLLITGLEKLLPIAEPVAALFGVEMPESLEGWKFAAEETTGAVGELAHETEFVGPIIRDVTEAVVEQTVGEERLAVATRETVAAVAELPDPLEQAAALVKELTDAERDAEKAALAAAKATDEFVTSLESIFAPAPVAVDVEFPDAGTLQGGLDTVMGLMQPPASVREALGPTIGQHMVDGLESTFSSQNVGATIARAMEGGGGAEGAARALGAQIGAHIGEAMEEQGAKMGGKMGSALSFLGPFAGLAIQGAITLGGKLAGAIGRALGNPSEAVVAARQTMGAYAATIDADTVNQERLQDWIGGGFTIDHAKIVTQFQDIAIASGESSQAGVDLWLRYQAAVEDGNQAAIDAVLAQAEAWGMTAEEATAAGDAAVAVQAAGTAAFAAIEAAGVAANVSIGASSDDLTARVEDNFDDQTDAAADSADAQEDAFDDLTDSLVGAYRNIRDAADEAYVEAGNAALASGASQAEAAATGEAAWADMYAQGQAMRVEEMAREAAFSAALKAIQEGRADDAIGEAQRAYSETQAAALAAFDVITKAFDAIPTSKTFTFNIKTVGGLGGGGGGRVGGGVGGGGGGGGGTFSGGERHGTYHTSGAGGWVGPGQPDAPTGLIKSGDYNWIKDPNFTPLIQHGDPGYDKTKDPRSYYEQDLTRHHGPGYWEAYYGSLDRYARIGSEMNEASRNQANEIDAELGLAEWDGYMYVRPGDIPDEERDWGPAPGWQERVRLYRLLTGDTNPDPAYDGAAFGGSPDDWQPEARAIGGPVMPGQFYKVGELGPELFSPGQPGNIIPNGGGGQQPVINLAPVIKVEIGRRTLDRVTVEDTPRNVRRLVGH